MRTVPAAGSLRPWVRPVLGAAAAVVVAALVAVAVLCWSTASREHRDSQPLAGGRTTTGTVVAATTLCGHVCDHRAVVAYQVAGTTFHLIGAPQDATPQIGTLVRVSYLPSDPGTGRDLDAHRSITAVLYAAAVVAAVAAAVVGLGGALLLARTRRT